MEGSTDMNPLILDFAEEVEIIYDSSGRQVTFAQTSRGTHDEPDTAGLD